MPRNKRMDSPKYTAGTDGTPVALTKRRLRCKIIFPLITIASSTGHR